ncbi:hypothetical protein FHI69_22505 [Janthinobacterium lividum]|uniref:Uncharacterized protein n=1 Tax=Janthinobacterium lividum TaxID=29581 RepID=A0A5C4NH45_9BURK|nr:hypothetical protein [Janthinobacterium lividum]TNC73943.1 hypothetical protein FHI69_22505 [Janthinobacterium lividum]
MEMKRIETAADHAAALKEIDGLMAADLGTPEGNRLNVLAAQVQAYEAQNFSTELTKPIGASELENHEHPDLAASPRAPSQPGDPLEARQSCRLVALKAAEGLWKDRTDIPKDGVKYQN